MVLVCLISLLFVILVHGRLNVGLNIDPKNEMFGNPSPKDIKDVNSTWVRIEYKDDSSDPSSPSQLDFFHQIVQNFLSQNIKTLLLLDYSSMVGKRSFSLIFKFFIEKQGFPGENGSKQQWQSYSVQFCQRISALGPLIQISGAVEVWNEEDLLGSM